MFQLGVHEALVLLPHSVDILLLLQATLALKEFMCKVDILLLLQATLALKKPIV